MVSRKSLVSGLGDAEGGLITRAATRKMQVAALMAVLNFMIPIVELELTQYSSSAIEERKGNKGSLMLTDL